MTRRKRLLSVLAAIVVCVLIAGSVGVGLDLMRRQRSIEKRDRVLELVEVGMPGQDAISVLREHGFSVSEHEGETPFGSSPYLVVPIDTKPHYLKAMAYSTGMDTEWIGPVMSVVIHLDDERKIERLD